MRGNDGRELAVWEGGGSRSVLLHSATRLRTIFNLLQAQLLLVAMLLFGATAISCRYTGSGVCTCLLFVKAKADRLDVMGVKIVRPVQVNTVWNYSVGGGGGGGG